MLKRIDWLRCAESRMGRRPAYAECEVPGTAPPLCAGYAADGLYRDPVCSIHFVVTLVGVF